MRKIEALADGIMDAGLVSVVNRRVRRRSSLKMNCYASGRNQPQSGCAGRISGRWHAQNHTVNLATIAIACAVGYLNFRALRQAGVSTAHT